MIRVVVHAEEFLRDLHRLEDDVDAGAQSALAASVSGAADNARETTLWKDGTKGDRRLRDNIRAMVSAGGFAGSVSADAKYASFLENGTRAHEIHARPGGVLRFQVNGQWVSARAVQHPGTKPRPFMALAALKGAEILTRELEKNIAKATEGFNS